MPFWLTLALPASTCDSRCALAWTFERSEEQYLASDIAKRDNGADVGKKWFCLKQSFKVVDEICEVKFTCK
ncbi:hypothetical protein LL14B4_03535 [Lactococcus lactis subsp. lactis]|uniref:Uncharacterized protein n=1 Tax=Lactococcus lactis subsp. lactis TaxID=1360 RepID=A0A2Z3KCX0_LACLL|nr:hypothetical protein LL14B4_03535 [Lactococcus lactis subsp. lactis]